MKKLLVIIPNRLSEIVAKGEVVEEYYNQGGIFDEVLILSTVDDYLDELSRIGVQKMVGRAQWQSRHINKAAYWCFLSNCKFLIRLAGGPLVRAAINFQPRLIRCYGNQDSAYLGWLIKKRLNIPLIVSLHCVPDFNRTSFLKTAKSIAKIFWIFIFFWQKRLEKWINGRADALIAVYQPARLYLQKNNGQRVNLIYNVVAKNIPSKTDFTPHKPWRLVTVGNQIKNVKNSANIILALRGLNVRLDVIGQGDLHSFLEQLVREHKLEGKVNFMAAVKNERLVAALKDYDIFVFQTLAPELSKAVIEAMLAGLPVIHNYLPEGYPYEMPGDCWHLVEDSPTGYKQGIEKLMSDDGFREGLARRGNRFAKDNLAPELMEQKIKKLYEMFSH